VWFNLCPLNVRTLFREVIILFFLAQFSLGGNAGKKIYIQMLHMKLVRSFTVVSIWLICGGRESKNTLWRQWWSLVYTFFIERVSARTLSACSCALSHSIPIPQTQQLRHHVHSHHARYFADTMQSIVINILFHYYSPTSGADRL